MTKNRFYTFDFFLPQLPNFVHIELGGWVLEMTESNY